MESENSEPLVFLLHSDGSLAWVSGAAPSGGQVDGQAIWSCYSSEDQHRVQEGLAKLMLASEEEFQTEVRGKGGDRLVLSMHRLPVRQAAEHAVIGWTHRLSEGVLSLTQREREVLLLVCDELTTEEIAKTLHISPATVETHRQHIAKKLDSKSVAGQVRAAIRGGLIDP